MLSKTQRLGGDEKMNGVKREEKFIKMPKDALSNETVYEIVLTDENGIKIRGKREQNCKAKILIKKGTVRDITKPHYLFWSLELKDIFGNKTITSLTRDLFITIFEEVILHEIRNDIITGRKSDVQIYVDGLKNIETRINELIKLPIPEVYKFENQKNKL